MCFTQTGTERNHRSDIRIAFTSPFEGKKNLSTSTSDACTVEQMKKGMLARHE